MENSSPGLLGSGGKEVTHATEVERIQDPGGQGDTCLEFCSAAFCELLSVSIQETHWVWARLRRHTAKLSLWTSLEAEVGEGLLLPRQKKHWDIEKVPSSASPWIARRQTLGSR